MRFLRIFGQWSGFFCAALVMGTSADEAEFGRMVYALASMTCLLLVYMYGDPDR